ELTHVPIKQIPIVIKKARDLGADLILVHGQTLAEPVVEGTNITALNNDIDILAHPGLITVKEARLAAKKGIYLEITTRKGHSWTNGHVVKITRKVGAKLLLNNDMHRPEDILKPALLEEIACGAGLSKQDYKRMLVNAKNLIKAKTGINVGLSLL
ncbi:MAG: histidinol phosphate phosphatase domain-containing protein, partial [Candidatus Omnitrophica bacterium]|nr:histidinol phosphate phosphatase domain-containing protein [Candidatus Omnitrophota bacterium]